MKIIFNTEQRLPINFEILFNLKDSKININYEINIKGFNVRKVLDICRFHNEFVLGGLLRLLIMMKEYY